MENGNNNNDLEDNEGEPFGLLMDGYIGDWNHYIGVENFLQDDNNDLEEGCPQITNIEYTYAVIDENNFCGLVVTKLDAVLPDENTSYQYSFYLIPYNPEELETEDYFELTYLYPNDYYGVYKNNNGKNDDDDDESKNNKIEKYNIRYVNYNEIELCVPLQTLYSNSTEFNSSGYFLFEAFTFFNASPNENEWINCDQSYTSFPRTIDNKTKNE